MLVYFAIFLAVLLGFCGLAVDVGRLELRSLQLQTAADAGALSGAAEWGRGTTATAWMAAAQSDAQATQALNSYSTSGTTITSQLTASSGPYATDYAAVQTTVSQAVPTMFLGLIQGGATSVTVTRIAVADPPPCMYFFSNPAAAHAGGGIDMSSSRINLSCPIYVKGVPVIDGFSRVQNHQIKSSANLSGAAPGGGSSTYLPFYKYPVLSDPLAYVVAPSYTGCDYIGMTVIFPTILQPGRYCGGVFNAPGLTVIGVTVTLAPGLYIFTNGVNFTNAAVNGSGVTLYLTKGGLFGYGTFYSSNTAWNVSAPVNSSAQGIPGVVIMNDRNWVGGNEDFIFDYGSWTGDGIMYTTGTGIYDNQVNMSGPNYFNMVTANLYNRFATITASANYATVVGGSPLHNAVNLVQ